MSKSKVIIKIENGNNQKFLECLLKLGIAKDIFAILDEESKAILNSCFQFTFYKSVCFKYMTFIYDFLIDL